MLDEVINHKASKAIVAYAKSIDTTVLGHNNDGNNLPACERRTIRTLYRFHSTQIQYRAEESR